MVGPVIATFGNEAQKKRFLAPTANLDIWWCQGFSEPGSGSDLASLKTRAVREGDHYIVNGQKTWTTLGQYADWIFCLVRTNPDVKKQAGISFLLIDMKTPGVTVRPIITIEGHHEVNEVFFDDVRVPVENIVGEENKGWDYAKFLLANERSGIARIGMTKERLGRVGRLAREIPKHAGTMWDDVDFRSRLAQVEIELKALEITQMRVIANQMKAASDKPDPSSILKIKGSGCSRHRPNCCSSLPALTARSARIARMATNYPTSTGPMERRRSISTIARSRSTAVPTRSSTT
jgi:alkylation response protein AidB-like acyl-CoA dehydrogenase